MLLIKEQTPSATTGEISLAFVMQMMPKGASVAAHNPNYVDPGVRGEGAEEICIISIETTMHRELSHLTHSSVERGKI